MMARIKRLVRGEFPDRHETWREYMDRETPLPIVTLCCCAAMVLMLALAEAVDRGIV